MKLSLLTATFAAAALGMAGCATQSAAGHAAPTPSGPAARVLELPASAGGAGTVIASTQRLRIDPTHPVLLAPNVPHAVEPDAGTDLVLLVHHLGRKPNP